MAAASTTAAEDAAMADLEKALQSFHWKEGVVCRAKRQLFSDCSEENLKGVQSLKAMLCIGRDEVYEVAQEVIDSGVIARLVQFLRDGSREVRWPAAFCLTNVAAGRDEQTDAVVKAGAVPVLVETLRCKEPLLRRQALFCLANVAGSAQWHRDLLASHPDYVNALLFAAMVASDPKVKSLVCWNFRNMCLLGGAPNSTTEAAIDFFMDHIWQSCSDKAWASCARFCFETLAGCCREPHGRAHLAKRSAKLIPDLVNCLLGSAGAAPIEHVLEITMWQLTEAGDTPRETLGRNAAYVQKLATIAAGAKGGTQCQDFALKVLLLLVTPKNAPTPSRRIMELISNQQEALLAMPAQVFRETQAGPADASAVVTREAAALLFLRAATHAAFVEQLFMSILSTALPFELVLDILEFAVMQARYNRETAAAAASIATPPTIQLPGESAVMCPSVTETLTKEITVESLRLMLVLLEQGANLQSKSGLHFNPVAKAFYDLEAMERLQQVLTAIGYDVECQQVGQRVLAFIGGC